MFDDEVNRGSDIFFYLTIIWLFYKCSGEFFLNLIRIVFEV